MRKKRKNNTGRFITAFSIIGFVLSFAVIGQFISTTNTGEYSSTNQNVATTQIAKKENFVDYVPDELNISLKYNDKVWNFNKEDFKIGEGIMSAVKTAQNANSTNTSTNLLDGLFKNNNSEQIENSNYSLAFNQIFTGFEQKINNISTQIETEPVDSTVKFSPNSTKKFEITPSKLGKCIDRKKLYEDVKNNMKITNNVSIDIQTIDIYPEKTEEYYNDKLEKMSAFSTSLENSQEGRRFNVGFALEKFNGKVIKSGEKVSFNEVAGPMTNETGYKNAIVIIDGKFTEGVGGGICQASSTLYNAIVLAGLKVDEVHSHSLPIKYVQPALDAMVSDGYADLVFTNDSPYDIYIETSCDDKNASVTIYGKSLEDGVTIKSIGEIIKKVPAPEDKVIADTYGEYAEKIKYVGEFYRLTYGKDGYEAKSYLEYYKDGKLIKKVDNRKETYYGQAGIVMEGTQEKPTETKREIKSEESVENLQGNNELKTETNTQSNIDNQENDKKIINRENLVNDNKISDTSTEYDNQTDAIINNELDEQSVNEFFNEKNNEENIKNTLEENKILEENLSEQNNNEIEKNLKNDEKNAEISEKNEKNTLKIEKNENLISNEEKLDDKKIVEPTIVEEVINDNQNLNVNDNIENMNTIIEYSDNKPTKKLEDKVKNIPYVTESNSKPNKVIVKKLSSI